jgi:hypothetical protein
MFPVDRMEKDLPVTFAVDINGNAFVVEFPESHKKGLDGSHFDDNNINGIPKDLGPGCYRGVMDFRFQQGYSEGFRADGESEWEFTVTKYEKVA